MGPRCTCGSAKCGSPNHSDWCDINRRFPEFEQEEDTAEIRASIRTRPTSSKTPGAGVLFDPFGILINDDDDFDVLIDDALDALDGTGQG